MFHVAPDDHIKRGKVTDVYFERVTESLKSKGINPFVTMEVRTSGLPNRWEWAVFAGLEELLNLVEGLPVSMRALDEGTIFRAGEPVLSMSGRYLDFGVYETAILGFICQASGIATNAARCKMAAGDRLVISFGARRMHPAIAPMIERNAFIGGCDGVAVIESAELIGEPPWGTMSHSLILCAKDERTAYEAFDQAVDPAVRRVALVDTFQDEKFGAVFAAKVFGDKLYAVRLDTPGSRRGDFLQILKEVRWELDIRGFRDVKIFVSGGLDEDSIIELNPYADAYGVGTHISNSPVVNFSMDIVEVDGEPLAKRGRESGAKQLWVCDSCSHRFQTLSTEVVAKCDVCGGLLRALLVEYVKDGKIIKNPPAPREIRSFVLSQLANSIKP